MIEYINLNLWFQKLAKIDVNQILALQSDLKNRPIKTKQSGY